MGRYREKAREPRMKVATIAAKPRRHATEIDSASQMPDRAVAMPYDAASKVEAGTPTNGDISLNPCSAIMSAAKREKSPMSARGTAKKSLMARSNGGMGAGLEADTMLLLATISACAGEANVAEIGNNSASRKVPEDPLSGSGIK